MGQEPTSKELAPNELYKKYFPESEWVNCEWVIKHESGGDPNAVNINHDIHKSKDIGLWQINTYWQRHRYMSQNELYDPERSTRIAYEIWQDNYWDAWVSWKNK